MGFDAAEVVRPLDWTFVKYDAGEGTVPEPSDKDIEQLFRDLSKVSKGIMDKAGIGQMASDAAPEQVMQALADLESDVGITVMVNGFTKAFAKLCKGQPSATQLNKLPMRVRMAFFVWLANELRPEVAGAGSMNQLSANGLTGIGTRA